MLGSQVLKTPPPILKSRFKSKSANKRLACVCPGFELKQWRYTLLAEHLMDWLPDFAVRHDDLPRKLTTTTDYRKLIEIAAKRVYETGKTANRGEIGELLLHAICRQFSGTFPTVSKVYYKTSSNEVVKGFDLVHTRYSPKQNELQLWLGEAKFYRDGKRAVTDAITSVRKHLDAGFLKSEKMLLGGKVAKNTPGYSKLESLFEKDTQLDKIFERLIIPVLIAYDSEHTFAYSDDVIYDKKLSDEINKLQERFTKALPSKISLYCFYVPMNSKERLVKAFDKRLAAYS